MRLAFAVTFVCLLFFVWRLSGLAFPYIYICIELTNRNVMLKLMHLNWW